MPRPDRSSEIDAVLLARVARHPQDLVAVAGEELGLTRQTIVGRVRALIEAGYLAKSGTTRPTYSLGPSRRGVFTHPLRGLDENGVWLRDVAPLLRGLPANLIDICHHGLTEMVNNAIDHSGGSHLRVFVDRTLEAVTLMVSDDGVGIFRKITAALDLPDERLALLELSKGKLTTDPRRHTGEGVFFTSRMFDRFQIASGELVFDHNDAQADDLLDDIEPRYARRGTTVLMEIATKSKRTAKQVFDKFSSGPDDYAFAKTVVPVRLAKVGDENLVSRSQAKRLMQRVERFRTVMLDFAGVTSIGQAFADEVFRVFANAHPDVELVPMHATPTVQQMIRRAQLAREEGR
ncbi:MAG: ATP-binding region, ATPase-like [Rhodanobacteraceae bacterium]|jgi:anti-sigma regulatory factor (Ser/Thr protein kinase)|nr:MAG: ATP-binding region, ATPase-like [Rhodanobacteraceae bacterium]